MMAGQNSLLPDGAAANKGPIRDVTVVGGGNIGLALAAILGRAGWRVTLVSSRPACFGREIEAQDPVSGRSWTAPLAAVTDDLAEAAARAELVLLSYPSFMLERTFRDLAGLVRPGTAVGVVPGSGGAEFLARPLLDRGLTVFGFDRVPAIARLKEYGRSVYLSPKPAVRLAALPAGAAEPLSRLLGQALSPLKCSPLSNYLTVTLTPSNPILHPARNYGLFRDWRPGELRPDRPGFYRDWDETSSRVLMALDGEVQDICRAYGSGPGGLDLAGVIPLSLHYEADSPEALTRKIRSLPALAAIEAPMVEEEGGFRPDFQSRYFTEDVPFGLCVLKGLAALAGRPTPTLDEVLAWHQAVMGRQFIDPQGRPGRDAAGCADPRRFGARSREDILALY